MSLCKLNTVKKAQKDQGRCTKCGKEIHAGDGYRWWKGRYTGRYVRCLDTQCYPQPYERETNATRSSFMQAEALVGAVQSIEDDPQNAATDLRQAIELVEEVRDTLQERVDAWQGTGFENGQQYQSCEDTIYNLDDWLSTAESVADELEEVDIAVLDVAEDGPEYAELYDQLVADTQQAIGQLEDVPELDMGA